MDGDLKGRIKCATKNWIGIAYKIPKDKINEAKEMEPLKKLGIYFLFGKNKENKPTIYVGQAIKRANGNGLLGRILEPHKNQNNQNININDWTEAITFTIKDTDSIDTDDLNYLENKFYNLAKIANRYYVLNNKEPEIGNPNEEKESQLEEFVKYVKLFTEILGHKVFEPINADEIINYQFNESTTSENNVVRNEIPQETQQEAQHSEIPVAIDNDVVYYSYTYKKETAYLKKINDKKFILLKGSKISPDTKQSCDEYIIKERNKYKDKINSDGVLLEDIKLDNLKFPSGIAKFITGSSVSGKDWKEEPNFSLENIKSKIVNNNDDLLYMTYKEANAKCIRTNDGFLVLKGSKINPTVTNSCGKEIIQAREEHKDKIDSSYILKENILFDSSSRSAGFVAGHSVSGPIFWKDKNGKSLKELEQQ